MHLLLIEDDKALAEQVIAQLSAQGYRVRWLADGEIALREDPAPYALIVLDLMLPKVNGLEILKNYRSRSDTPILVLSAKQDAVVKVKALQLGADDYLTKPFWPEELSARIAARLRRPILKREGGVEIGRLFVDLTAHRASVDAEDIQLTRAEWELLAALARQTGAAISREDLMEATLDPSRDGTMRTLDVHVSRLRKKLGPCSNYLHTIWGVGYRLEVKD
ncbi:MAG TPA: response regulator transcription factor [Planctomycetes bacterium]|nr:response regulator transcription factor [Planctomycetota bacterium]HIL36032.1 response regulator transcription factor [Planctomycetota bacterium]